MFFGHKEEKKRGGIFWPIRLLLSLTMMGILALGVFQAFRYFSGVDPVKMDPKTLILSLATSEGAEGLIKEILGFNLSSLSSLGNSSDLGIKQSVKKQHNPNAKVILKFALVADSHNDNKNLSQALSLAKGKGAKFVVGLGDYTNVGTDEELLAAYNTFKASNLPFYVTAGDHDLWNARDKGSPNASDHFEAIFGTPYQSFGDSGVRLILVYNSDNYLGLDQTQMSWLQDELNQETGKTILVFAQEPFYHPSSDHVMGKENHNVSKQASQIIEMLKDSKVSGAFFGDTHYFSEYTEPKSGINMVSLGALTGERNAQRPRFGMVEVFDDGTYNIEDIELP